LRLVDQDGRGTHDEALRCRTSDLELAGVVESMNGRGPPEGGLRLAHGFGAFEGNRSKSRQKLIQLPIDKPRLITCHHETIPIGRRLSYQMDGCYNTKRTGGDSRGDCVRATSPKYASPDDIEQRADCQTVTMTEPERERRLAISEIGG
jgi:hypothetical protein